MNLSMAMATINIVPSILANVKKLSEENPIVNIYPNPNTGSFKLQIDNEIKNGEVLILNSLGQEIHSQTVSKGINEINIKEVANGLFYYSILENKRTVRAGKISIE